MKVAVTGGAGFIGTAVCRQLEQAGHTPIVIDRRTGGDVRNGDLVAERIDGCEHVIHLAGVLGTDELFDDPYAAVDMNIIGTLRVLDACVKAGAGYVGITMHDHFPSIYTATKQAAQRLGSAYHNAYGLPVCHVRAFNAYGAGQAHGPGHPRKIIPAFSCEAWSGKPITVWGDGTQTVDLIHVDELARVLVEAVNIGDDAVIDAGTGCAVSVNQVAQFVLDVTGSNAGIVCQPMRRGEVPSHIAARGLGWDRLTGPPHGGKNDFRLLARTVIAYQNHEQVTHAA